MRNERPTIVQERTKENLCSVSTGDKFAAKVLILESSSTRLSVEYFVQSAMAKLRKPLSIDVFTFLRGYETNRITSSMLAVT